MKTTLSQALHMTKQPYYNGSGILLLSDVKGYVNKETRSLRNCLACFSYM